MLSKWFGFALSCSLVIAHMGVSVAQESTLPQLKADLISPWLVMVDGESRTRTLRITGVAQKDAANYPLDADYGFSDSQLSPVKAEISQLGQERKLTITTQSNSKIIATQIPGMAFAGTFTNSNGNTKNVRLEKSSEEELKGKIAAAQIIQPKLSDYVSVPCIATGDQCVDKPDLKVGDRWVFRAVNIFNNEETSRYEQKVTGVYGDVISLEQTTLSSNAGGNVGRTTKSRADRATWTFHDSRIFEGKVVILGFPLEVGKTWKNAYKWNRADSGTTAFNGSVKVEGWEDVQVPAGKFRTLKVVHTNGYSAQQSGQSWSGTQSETYWYAPEVKRFVKREFIDGQGGNRIRTELTEYAAN